VEDEINKEVQATVNLGKPVGISLEGFEKHVSDLVHGEMEAKINQ
jgi:hypothetical protein